jgi:tRNA/tmRNA/rRNA uracil-C5-methylase (TrmA/RlmC/RlmD family)
VRVNPTVGTSTNLYSYRSKLTPHYDAPKTLNELKIGFQKRGTRTIVDIAECIIGTTSINAEFIEARKELKESFKLALPKKGATLLFR